MLKRKALDDLKKWYHGINHRTPLVIRGARQVGKSTLVRMFAEELGLELFEINFEKEKFKSLDETKIDIQRLLDECQFRVGKILTTNSLLFFDEIQEQGSLFKYLRYLYEERPDIPVIATGSLLEFFLNSGENSFPVGRVSFYHLGPMDFEEFLWATNDHFLASKLDNLNSPLPDEFLSKAKERLKDFFYVGGMPKAVSLFSIEKSLVNVRSVQTQILETYISDFPKYKLKNVKTMIDLELIGHIFSSIVLKLGQKVIYSKIDSDLRAKEIKKILSLLVDARLIIKCVHTSANSVPLTGESDTSIFKLYFLDVGLMNALLNVDFNTIDQEMKNNFNSKGVMAEQFVAQHLAYMGGHERSPELFYHLRDKGTQKAEVDFIFSQGTEIIPVEVKSGATGRLKSLFYFAKEKQECKRAIKISMSNFAIEEVSHKMPQGKDGSEVVRLNLIQYPLYAVCVLSKI